MSARYMQPLRILIQSAFMGVIVWNGLLFYRFVQIVIAGDIDSLVVRPPAIDGFLPISGFLGTICWVKSGTINSIHPAAVVIFVTVICGSLLLRRSFCSWICPLATLSECAWKTGFRVLRRNWRLPPWLDAVLRCLKYLLMGFFILFIGIFMSAKTQFDFIQSDYHKISDVHLMNFFLQISSTALLFFLVLVISSFFLRNPFCRYLCPYGALLGLVATLSPLRVTRNIDRCVSCGACSQVCPASIDVMHTKSVVSPECIGCWRCISHCRFNEALSMRAARRFVVPGFIFASLVVLLFWGGTIIGKLNGTWYNAIPISEYVRIVGK